MSIREMKVDDLKRIVELEKDLFLSPWNEEDFIHELKENPMAGYYILEKENQIIELDLEVPVSMNMWALQPEIFDILDSKFKLFLSQLENDNFKDEYLLPTIIGSLLKENQVEVTVLKSLDNWFGVTYKEDKQTVIESIQKLTAVGVYPQKLF